MLLIEFGKFSVMLLIVMAAIRMWQMHINSAGTVSHSLAFLFH